MGSAFTYQGFLKEIEKDKPADGTYDFEFRIYDNPNEPNIAHLAEVFEDDVNVVDGYFIVELDFGSDVFDGNALWLETGVRPGDLGDPDEYTTLSPRQELTPVPYAVYAATAAAVAGGEPNYIPKFVKGAKLTNSVMYESGGNVGIGKIDPATKLDVNGTVRAAAFEGDGSALTNLPVNGMPAGVIVMWSGAIGSIPAGWALCDGTNGTPDLRDRFVVGAGSTYAVAATGGEATHTLTIDEMPAHTHNYEGVSWYDKFDGGNWWSPGNAQTKTSTPTGGNQSHENRPPYYALAYIKKL